MEKSCTACRADLEKDIVKIDKSVNAHHADADKHNTSASVSLLKDILFRVTRIEDRMFNGKPKESD